MFGHVTLCYCILSVFIGDGDGSWCQSLNSIKFCNWKLELTTSKMSTMMSAAAKATTSDVATRLISADFEVFGKVQGVFFRKYTKAKGATLGLRGWVQNTSKGTVIGQMEGDREKITEMKHWLQNEGSPKSRISKVVFRNEQSIDKYSFNDFDVRK